MVDALLVIVLLLLVIDLHLVGNTRDVGDALRLLKLLESGSVA